MQAKLIIDGVPFKGKNLIGEKFNRALVIDFDHRKTVRKNDVVIATVIYWKCRCDCGKEFVAAGVKLTSGHTQSCGCWQQLKAKEARTIHGCSPRNGKKHPAYESWRGMRERCSSTTHEGWHFYGGRGIRVCERWNSFVLFKEDMFASWSIGLTIDRIDVNGNYSCGKCSECLRNYWPMNCQWATDEQQSRNRRDNVWIEFQEERKILQDWADEFGMSSQTLGHRLRLGWTMEAAKLTPVSTSSRLRVWNNPTGTPQ